MTSDLYGVSGWNCFVACKSHNIRENLTLKKTPKKYIYLLDNIFLEQKQFKMKQTDLIWQNFGSSWICVLLSNDFMPPFFVLPCDCLILCENLIGLKDAHIAGKNHFWVCL